MFQYKIFPSFCTVSISKPSKYTEEPFYNIDFDIIDAFWDTLASSCLQDEEFLLASKSLAGTVHIRWLLKNQIPFTYTIDVEPNYHMWASGVVYQRTVSLTINIPDPKHAILFKLKWL